MADARYGSLAFAEQIQFFLGKLSLPTATWRDIWQSAHDRAFVVAGAMKADLIDDLRMAVQKGIDQGTTLDEFRRDFEAIVAHHGWTGWTGEGTKAGRAWRTRVIYETNLRTSYAAGRWAQLKAMGVPYLRYKHNDNVLNPRPHHLAWDGTVLRADDPWWSTHTAPNGWGCKCWIEGVSERELARSGKDGPDQAPTAPDDLTGIDEGWGYAPGASWWPVFDKYPHDTARAIVKSYAADGVMQRWFDRVSGQVAQWLRLPLSVGLAGDALVRAWRQARLIPSERLPLAVISPAVKALLGTERQVVMLSADTLVKQLVKREGQGHAASWYETLQGMLDGAPVITHDGSQKVIYWRKGDVIWMAVVKTTRARDEVYLISLHQTDAKEVKKKVSPDDWGKLGVA